MILSVALDEHSPIDSLRVNAGDWQTNGGESIVLVAELAGRLKARCANSRAMG
jgi:hypothetical protein